MWFAKFYFQPIKIDDFGSPKKNSSIKLIEIIEFYLKQKRIDEKAKKNHFFYC